MTNVHIMSPAAQAVLRKLQQGGNVGEPRVFPGSFAFSSHAHAFLNNAYELCDEKDQMSDFRVYGALYLLRHGLELMLKCLVRNHVVDEILRGAMTPGLNFDGLCTATSQTKKTKPQLMRALCVMRNVMQDRVVHPQCHTVNIDAANADKALDYLRQNPRTDRERFAIVWSGATFGHDLIALWHQAKPIVDIMAAPAVRHAAEIGFPTPLSSGDLESLCELLGSLDDGGDGFRYPSGIDGAWYVTTPNISLEALSEVIDEVMNTCQVFESVRQEYYQMSTVRSPEPQYPV